MPPSTDEKQEKHFAQAPRVIAFFREIKAGTYTTERSWIELQLVPGEYEEIERQLERDEDLWGVVQDKIRCVCEKTWMNKNMVANDRNGQVRL